MQVLQQVEVRPHQLHVFVQLMQNAADMTSVDVKGAIAQLNMGVDHIVSSIAFISKIHSVAAMPGPFEQSRLWQLRHVVTEVMSLLPCLRVMVSCDGCVSFAGEGKTYIILPMLLLAHAHSSTQELVQLNLLPELMSQVLDKYDEMLTGALSCCQFSIAHICAVLISLLTLASLRL